MPYTKEGIVPDIIINPHAIPSRMTLNQLMEVVMGKSCCQGGYMGDSTPFCNANAIDTISKTLKSYGYDGLWNRGNVMADWMEDKLIVKYLLDRHIISV